ncbi:hypothetical protein ANOBCDAF_00669 [Pleomorphomonas sp. T1.2MG-36]|nr:hypothetical protein ANOBCDAF_00669 [Pleomorphomonas sp. T1.2MG-36]
MASLSISIWKGLTGYHVILPDKFKLRKTVPREMPGSCAFRAEEMLRELGELAVNASWKAPYLYRLGFLRG